MRVGLVIYGSLDNISGGFLYDRTLVQHLRRLGDQVEVISLPWRNYPRHLVDNFSRNLLQRLLQADFDVLLQDELCHPSLVWTNRRLRKAVRYPLVSIIHLLRWTEPHRAWRKWLYRWVEERYLGTVDGFIFNSVATRDLVEGQVGPNPLGVVAYPGRDHLSPALTPEQITARARDPGPLRVLFVGNLIPRKGLHLLLEALARLPSKEWRLTALGSLTMDPSYVGTIRRQIGRSGISDNVALLGARPNQEVASRLAQSHLLAVPSLYEAFGIVYVEAQGFGVPSIGSIAGAAGETIDHGRNGFLVNPSNASALAVHLQELSHDRERLVQMSLEAYRDFGTHPTWAETTDRIRELLGTMVS